MAAILSRPQCVKGVYTIQIVISWMMPPGVTHMVIVGVLCVVFVLIIMFFWCLFFMFFLIVWHDLSIRCPNLRDIYEKDKIFKTVTSASGFFSSSSPADISMRHHSMREPSEVNPLRVGDAHIRQWTGSSLNQTLAWRQTDTKPLPAHIMIYCHLDRRFKLERNFKHNAFSFK